MHLAGVLVADVLARPEVLHELASRDDGVRLKTIYQAAEIFLEAVKALESLVEIFFLIEPVVNVAPQFRPVVDKCEIRPPDNFIERAKGLRKQIAQFDFNLRCNPCQACANASRRAIVSFTESGGEDQNSFHVLLG